MSLVSIGLSGQSSPPHAVNRQVAVHKVIVEANGDIVDTVSIDAGTVVAIKVGDHKLLHAIAPIHVAFFIHFQALFRVSFTAFLVFSTKTSLLLF